LVKASREERTLVDWQRHPGVSDVTKKQKRHRKTKGDEMNVLSSDDRR
jgi:hypothetical protein